MTRALLFDLDDTLYLEEEFVRSGIDAVARHLAPRLGVGRDELVDRLWYDFRRLGRTGLFDRLVKAYPDSSLSVPELVAVYREHEPVLALSGEVCALLAGLRQRYKLAIVTDGLPATQKKKIAALQLEAMVDAIVYPWELDAPKPAPLAFHEACRLLEVTPDQAVIVGDDPFHDVEAARAAGIACIRIRTGRAREIPTRNPPAAYGEIASLADLEAMLDPAGPR